MTIALETTLWSASFPLIYSFNTWKKNFNIFLARKLIRAKSLPICTARKLIRAKLYQNHGARKFVRAKISTNKVHGTVLRPSCPFFCQSIVNYHMFSLTMWVLLVKSFALERFFL